MNATRPGRAWPHRLNDFIFPAFHEACEPLAPASIDKLVAAIGPTVQRYLTGARG